VLGHSRYEYDADGPSAMSVYRTEEKGIHVSEKNYRRLTRAMGEEESTRRGILRTKDIKVLHLTNEISYSFLNRDYERTEKLINQLEEKLDCTIKRNQQYLDYVKAELCYNCGKISSEDYERTMRENLTYGKIRFDEMIEKVWPFRERECQLVLGIVEMVRNRKDYEQQKYLLEQMLASLENEYMEKEYSAVYTIYVRLRISDVLGNMGYYREAIAMDEETLRVFEDNKEHRYLAETYYSIFWCYYMLKKKETLTEQEGTRCKECLLKAYYINKACYPAKDLYERRIRECYPEELE